MFWSHVFFLRQLGWQMRLVSTKINKYILRVKYFWECVYWVQQASWAKLYNIRNLCVQMYIFLKTSCVASASFVYLLIFCLHFREKYLYFSQIMQYVYYDPHFLLKSRFREMSLSDYVFNFYLPTYRLKRSFTLRGSWITKNKGSNTKPLILRSVAVEFEFMPCCKST